MRFEVDDYQALLDRQGGLCAICFLPPWLCQGLGKNLFADHDHSHCPPKRGGGSCGQCIRGLLCSTCNTRLGQHEAGKGAFLPEEVAYLAGGYKPLRRRVWRSEAEQQSSRNSKRRYRERIALGEWVPQVGTGRPHSQETRAKLSAARRGQVRTPESMAKQVAKQLAAWTPERRAEASRLAKQRGSGRGCFPTYDTSCRNGHERTEENTKHRADGTRECRDCRREYARADP